MSEGKMLKNATSPLGVDAGTRSSAAERMMTYRMLFRTPKRKNDATRRKRGCAAGTFRSDAVPCAETGETHLVFLVEVPHSPR